MQEQESSLFSFEELKAGETIEKPKISRKFDRNATLINPVVAEIGKVLKTSFGYQIGLFDGKNLNDVAYLTLNKTHLSYLIDELGDIPANWIGAKMKITGKAFDGKKDSQGKEILSPGVSVTLEVIEKPL